MIGSRTIKSAVGAMIAMYLAHHFALSFWTSAGIITILSVQATKKQSIAMAARRLVAVILALAISCVIFMCFGYTPAAFCIYLLIFIPIAVKTKSQDGIVPASVLVTHLMAFEEISLNILANELSLFGIGAAVALILNLYIPSIESELLAIRQQTEILMSDILIAMADLYSSDTGSNDLYNQLEAQIKLGKQLSYKYMNNYLAATITPYERYFNMREQQLITIYYMRKYFKPLTMNIPYANIVQQFTLDVAQSVKGEILAMELINTLDEIRVFFKESTLPVTREEFENRAILYYFLNELEQFLDIKIKFRENLGDKEFALYWKGYNSDNHSSRYK